jgi:iron complex outermembrane receptor protein
LLRRAIGWSFASLWLCAPRAAADDAYGAKAVVERTRMVATHGEDPTSSGTSIDLTDRVSLPRSLGDVLREAPGTRILSTGGVGAFSALSLRGADGEEAQVMLDEIPLTTPDGGAFDLSLFPAELFERVDVFRGGAPVWLGSGAIAGVVRLVPLRERKQSVRAALGAGSFGAYQLNGGAAVGTDDLVRVRSHVVVRGAQNDYPYDDDRGTLLDPSDDIEQRRKNEQLAEGSGLFELTAPVRGGRLSVIALGHERVGGYPGPASAPTPNIRRSRQRALIGASYERRRGGGSRSPRRRVQVVGAGSYSREEYTDLYGELGVSRRWDTLDHAYRGFLRFAGSLRLTRWLETTLVGSYAVDRYNWQNRFAFPKPTPSTRQTAAAALELAASGKLHGVGLELRPSLRLEWSHTRLDADQGLSGSFDATQNVLLPSARLGAGVSPLADLSLTASVATGGRLPTMFELFGDRGLTLPAPQLKPVHAVTYDGGATWCTRGTYFQSSLELHGFLQERRDMIAASLNAQKQARYQNLSEVRQRGVELGAFASLYDHFSLHGSLTYLNTETQLEKRLPLRPTWVMFARPELRTRFSKGPVSSAAASAELAYRSFVFTDPANLAPTSECRTAAISVAVGFLGERLHVVGRMDDVADVRCSDLLGYPLPGRSLFFSVSYREEKS